MPRADSRVFRIQLRSGIWNVKLDDLFYGDFRSLNNALEAVNEKAGGLQDAGLNVHIVTLSVSGALLTSKVLGAR